MSNKAYLFLLVIVSLFIYACSDDKVKNIPDVSHINPDVNIQRFEQDLFSLDSTNIEQGLASLIEKYPDFSTVFYENIIKDIEAPDKTRAELTNEFIRGPAIHYLYDTCQVVFGDMSDLKKDFGQLSQFYQYHFPDRPPFKVVTYISEYALGVFTYDDTILGIGLDFYLGENYPYYDAMIFPKYIKRTMDKEHLLAKSAEAITNNLVGNVEGNRLLDFMIHNGKILYIMDQLLPYAEDRIKLGYTQKQVDWCEQNELQIWTLFIGENLLYSSRKRDIQKLISYSPNSPGMPPAAPGRTANWVGWQIIKRYMERHPETSLQQLIDMKDAQKLLEESKYKPKR